MIGGTAASEAPRERYRGDRLELVRKVPTHARRILVVGCDTGLVTGILKKALGAQVAVLECNPAHVPVVSAIAAHVLSPEDLSAPPPFPIGFFDAAVILDPAPLAEHWVAFCQWLLPSLRAERGCVLLLCDNPAYGRSTAVAALPQPEELVHMASANGLGLYREWSDIDDAVMNEPESSPGHITLNGVSYAVPLPDSRARIATRRFLFKLVTAGYDPFRLSQALHGEGLFDAAYNELADVPESYRKDEGVAVVLHTQLLYYLSDYAAAHDAVVARAILFRAQEHLYEVIAKEPDFGLPHEYYAQIAERAGALCQAQKVRVSFCHTYPDKEGVAPPSGEAVPPKPDLWSARMASDFTWPGKPPRILYLIHPAPHYGLDLLYDGLCETLGDEQVCEWPYKPTLHGTTPTTHAHYPCHFARRGEALTYEQVRDQLANGQFDMVLLGDCDCELPLDAMKELTHMAQANGTPLMLVDAMDEYIDMRLIVFERLGLQKVDLYLKREMADFLDYGPDTWPMPFSFARSKIRPHDAPREVSFFWAGHRNFGFRRQYLEHLERSLGMDLSIKYEPEDYAKRIASSRIGLSIYGKGFDTVRYWELPAHGTMLLSDRIPLHIPHDFQDGVNAVLFNDLKELDDKLHHLLSHPDEVEQIAKAGEAHFLRHHTSEARARQTLHAIHTVCFGGLR